MLTQVCVQALTTAHNIPLALRVVEELFIGYRGVLQRLVAALNHTGHFECIGAQCTTNS